MNINTNIVAQESKHPTKINQEMQHLFFQKAKLGNITPSEESIEDSESSHKHNEYELHDGFEGFTAHHLLNILDDEDIVELSEIRKHLPKNTQTENNPITNKQPVANEKEFIYSEGKIYTIIHNELYSLRKARKHYNNR
jgi:hypothetical protein